MVTILGIDPGLATIGFGVIQGKGDQFKVLEAGVISTNSKLPLGERLLEIKKDLDLLLQKFKPDMVGIEELFFAKNVTNALKVAHVRGVILEQLTERGIPFFEFTPLQVKNNICGYGRADKKQMQVMTTRLLGLKKSPGTDDAADALGIAICAARVLRIKSK